MSVHCLESECIGPRDFPRAGTLNPSALGKSLGPRGVYFPIHPSSRQCTDSILAMPEFKSCNPLVAHYARQFFGDSFFCWCLILLVIHLCLWHHPHNRHSDQMDIVFEVLVLLIFKNLKLFLSSRTANRRQPYQFNITQTFSNIRLLRLTSSRKFCSSPSFQPKTSLKDESGKSTRNAHWISKANYFTLVQIF